GIRDKLVTGVQTCALPILEFSGVPGETHRRGQPFGEKGGSLEDPVAVLVLEPADLAAAGFLLELEVEIAAGRLRHVQAPAVVERSEERRVGKECRCRVVAG